MRSFSHILKNISAIAILLIMGFVFFSAYSLAGEAPKKGNAPEGIEAVKTSEVCMVNDSFMGKPQIPVLFEGKTYYGCCEGCVERIKNDRSVRFSKDPLTGREVDKAKAFITASPNGAALYFESSDTAGKYYASTKAKEGKTGGALR